MAHVQVTLVIKGKVANDSIFITTEKWSACDEVEFYLNKGKKPNYSYFVPSFSVCIQNFNLLNMQQEWQTYRFHDDFASWNLAPDESFKTSEDKFDHVRS
jgi:hypothetical protein